MATRTKGFVLAGGRSSRFGSDKALAEVDGVPMALRVFRAMQEAGLDPCFVARDRRLEHLGPVLVEDTSGPIHPLNGVVAALEQGGGLFAPCDLPWLPAQAFGRLPLGSAASGCPLLAHLGPSELERARRFVAESRSVRAFVQPLRTVELPQDWLVNVNRPDHLDRDSE